jgi:hypothetical protein
MATLALTHPCCWKEGAGLTAFLHFLHTHPVCETPKQLANYTLRPITDITRLIVAHPRGGFIRRASSSWLFTRYVSSRGMDHHPPCPTTALIGFRMPCNAATLQALIASQGLGHYFDFDRQQSHASPEEAQTRRIP